MIREVKRADIIYVHKSFFAFEIVILLLLQRKKLVYDLDDAEWIHMPLRSKLLAKRADRVFAGSHAIMEWAEKYNERVIFTPTVVRADVYKAHTVDHKKRPVTIGWIGQARPHYKIGNFKLIKNSLSELAKTNTQFRFVIIGSQDYPPLKNLFSKVPYEIVFVDSADWTLSDTSPSLIKEYNIQIGLMPLNDSPFNKAKCAYKAIEYMACGAVAVSSGVGEANYLIDDKKNGYLVRGNDEWSKVLSMLIDKEEERERVGALGQDKIGRLYSLENVAKLINEELQTLVK